MHKLRIGQTLLDRYKILDMHSGGMGEVYRVRHLEWGIDLAMKRPRPSFFRTEAAKQRFEDEAATWIELDLHPNIVTCHYVRRLEGIPLAFAEYVTGGSLLDSIANPEFYRSDSLSRILDFTIQASWGLGFAHEAGLVHGDVKPHNMLIDGTTVRLTDFGLSRADGREIDGKGMKVVGTRQYVAPEIAKGSQPSVASDIWAFGATLLHLLAGGLFWQWGPAVRQSLQSYIDGDLVGESSVPAIPPDLLDFLHQCFQEKPDDRPVSMSDVTSQLFKIYSGVTKHPYPRRRMDAGTELRAAGLNNRAISYLDLGKAAKACEAWQKAKELESSHLESRYNHSLWLWRGGRIDDTEVLRTVHEGKCDEEIKNFCLAHIHLERNDVVSARAAAANANDAQLASIIEGRVTASSDVLWEFSLREACSGPTALSSDLAAIATASGGKSYIEIINVNSGMSVRTIDAHEGQIRAIALSADASQVMSSASDGIVRVWDSGNGKCVRYHRGIASSGCTLSSPWFLMCASVDEDGTVIVWDILHGKVFHRWVGHDAIDARLSASGGCVVIATKDGWAIKRDICSGEVLLKQRIMAACTAISLDQREMVGTASGRTSMQGIADDTVVLFDPYEEHRHVNAYFQCHREPFYVATSADGERALCYERDGRTATIRLLSVPERRLLSTISTGQLCGIAAASNCDTVLTVQGRRAKLLQISIPETAYRAPYRLNTVQRAAEQVQNHSEVATLVKAARECLDQREFDSAMEQVAKARSVPGFEQAPGLCAICRELGTLLKQTAVRGCWKVMEGRDRLKVHALLAASDAPVAFAIGGGPYVAQWNMEKAELVSRAARHEWSSSAAAIAPHGKRLFAAVGESKVTNKVYRWDVRSDRLAEVPCPIAPNGKILAMISDSLGETLTLGGVGPTPTTGVRGFFAVWNVETCTMTRHIQTKEAVVALAVHEASGMVAVALGTGGVSVFTSIATRTPPTLLSRRETDCDDLQFLSESELWILEKRRGHHCIWDLQADKVAVLPQLPCAVSASFVSPAERLLIAGCVDGTIAMVDLTTQEIKQTIRAHPAPITAIVATSHLSDFMSVDRDGVLAFWFVDWDLDRTRVNVEKSLQEESSDQPSTAFVEPRDRAYAPHLTDGENCLNHMKLAWANRPRAKWLQATVSEESASWQRLITASLKYSDIDGPDTDEWPRLLWTRDREIIEALADFNFSYKHHSQYADPEREDFRRLRTAIQEVGQFPADRETEEELQALSSFVDQLELKLDK